jgi:Uma2 family endonuclease
LRGGPCRVRGPELRVRLEETGLYCYPDLTVVCGEPEFAPTNPVTLLNPRVVVEILSGSTEEYDRGAKVAHYRLRASIDLIVLVDSRKRRVELIRRNGDATWTWSDHLDGTVRILDHDVPLAELYDDVRLG